MNTNALMRLKRIMLPSVLGGFITLGAWCPARAQGPPPGLSPGVPDVAKMSQSHVPDDVVLDFLKGKGYTYNLTTDDVIYLNTAGVSKPVLDYMIASGPAGAPPAEVAPTPPVVATIAPTDGSSAPPPNLDLSYFQAQLSPYGQWVDMPPYGQVWHPAAASDPAWRPYSQDGHWVFTASGWFWQTDSPWGALVFHYGRWNLDPNAGWVWVPGYNWGPSWVAWRHSDGYYGWAPLPPAAEFRVGLGLSFNGIAVGANMDFGLRSDAFTFVGCNNIFDHDYRAVWVPQARMSVVFGGSVILNSYHVDHGRFVVEGFGREHIIEHSNIKVVNVVSVRDEVHVQNVTVVKNVTNIRSETNIRNESNVRNVNNERNVSNSKNVNNVSNQRNENNVSNTRNVNNTANQRNENNVSNTRNINNANNQRNVNTPATAAHPAAEGAAHPGAASPAERREAPGVGGAAATHPAANPAVHPAQPAVAHPAPAPAARPAVKPAAKPAPKPPAKPEGETKTP